MNIHLQFLHISTHIFPSCVYKSQLYNIILHKLFKRATFLIIEQLKEKNQLIVKL